ncbi:hypothetical protein N5853_11105 [Bartonella sp. HY329]|uniref:hypothetical protein n=1 Tax=unclassified Bartonella TaxID=2645622 RepID=UPI0021C74DE2|nr:MULTISPECIES: hypothetical protein [unclassified Bartonella]UXM94640.1 hypothetical protein N5853_11105 [Bartonella sp. HY329]UXN08963.1 hypothetical protein N5852_11115 [Bartonella sp. HY328]
MPIDLLNGFPGKSTKFELKYNQEFSRTASGQVLVQDMATPYWIASWNLYQSMHPYEFEEWRAKFIRMKGSLKKFYGYAPAKKPLAYLRDGVSMPDVSNVTLSTITTDRNSVSLAGLPSGFTLSVGDYMQIGEASLHNVYEVINATQVSVSPPLPSTILAGVKVKLTDTYCIMRISKDSLDMSIDDTGRGSISFDAEQVL